MTAGAAAYYHYPLSITLDTAVEMHWWTAGTDGPPVCEESTLLKSRNGARHGAVENSFV